MREESLEESYLATPDGRGPHAGVVVVHEASGLNDNIREICRRFAHEGYAALGVDLFKGRSRIVCMARMFSGAMRGNLDHYGVPALKTALAQLGDRQDVDENWMGAVGFCLGGSIVLTWGCTDDRLDAVAPFYGAAPRPREAIPTSVPCRRIMARQGLHDQGGRRASNRAVRGRHAARSEGLPGREALVVQRQVAQL